MKCPVCDHENQLNLDKCDGLKLQKCEKCGTPLQAKSNSTPENVENPPQKVEEKQTKDVKEEKAEPQLQQKLQQDQQPTQQQESEVHYFPSPQDIQDQQYQQQQYNPNAQRPIKQKSKLIGVVLAILICGAGYCYVDQWGKGIAFFLISAVLDFLTTFFVATFFFAIFGLIPFGLWLILRIFTIIDVFGKVDKYNAGLLY